MPTPPLKLWEVLKAEYESFHQPPPDVFVNDPRPLARALKDGLTDLSVYIRDRLPRPQQTLQLLTNWNGTDPLPEGLSDDLFEVFYALLEDQALVQHDRDQGRVGAALQNAGAGVTLQELQAQPLQGAMLYEVNALLLEAAYPGLVGRVDWAAGTDDERLSAMYRVILQRGHAALCLSGGGIRSATFNLGVLQGLARHGLLEKFDYLSTVSGGGFMGSWLSAWIHRHPAGLTGVVRALGQPPQRALEPDPKPLAWLRTYSNYLSPKLGLLNADTWTLVTIVLRNILLNWLVFVPWLLAVLLLPRLWVAFLSYRTFDNAQAASLVFALLAGWTFLTFVSLNLPSGHKTLEPPGGAEQPEPTGPVIRNDHQRAFVLVCLSAIILNAVGLVTFWARYRYWNEERIEPGGGWGVVLFSGAMVSLPWLVSLILHVRAATGRSFLNKVLLVFFSSLFVVIGLVITGFVTWGLANSPLFMNPLESAPGVRDPRFYASFAVPAVIGLLWVGGTFLSGFTSQYTGDADQEWWSRSGAWMMIVMIGWSAVCALVLYGPTLLFDPFIKYGWRVWTWTDWTDIGKALGVLGGVISGAVTLFGGFSVKTPANEKEAKQGGMTGTLLGLATSLLAPVFLGFLIILLSFATNWLVHGFARLVQNLPPRTVAGWIPPDLYARAATDHLAIINYSPLLLLLALLALVVGVGWVMGRLINTNKFSLHYMWRNRITRAYHGASRFDAAGNSARRPNRFTGLDPADDLPMHKLRVDGAGAPRRKLFHVLNLALNLSGGGRLDWQNRKAESFTVSPLHCGSFQPADVTTEQQPLGYRPSEDYGGGRGITLGTAVAISGAFVSPNMGYMMTSSVVRFLMTLFNVRFGWWLGNPGDVNSASEFYRLDSPRLSIWPVTEEALGLTNDRSRYVYLSDGGHFENLGLYEMVLRRCRFIVASDASTDDDYSFGSLGMAVRQIRVDLGVPIEFEDFAVVGATEGKDGRACALGRIRYSCVDAGAADGVLVYLKPTLTGREPRDVLNYARDNQSFPQEIIVDQWFSEAQFESYRALGSYIVNDLAGGVDRGRLSFAEFRQKAEAYIAQGSPAPELCDRVRDCLREFFREEG